MKTKIFAMVAVAAFLLGMTACSTEDNTSIDIKAMEQDLIGLWWDEFEYAGVTEDGDPFTTVLLAVQVDADHTGCLYLGLFDDTSEEPLVIYGGQEEAGFTWQLLDDGRVLLGDPVTGETYALARRMTRGDGGSYGENMTNASNTKLTYNSNGSVTATNGDYSGTLAKANAQQSADIGKKLSQRIKSNVNLGSGGKAPEGFGENDIR